MSQPGPDALPFPLVDALMPWQLLTPNSCNDNTASEQLQSPRTSEHIPEVVISSWGHQLKDVSLEQSKARPQHATPAWSPKPT